ncbi:MAG: C-terminal binding protein [Caldilineaceae bacterium]|nr:C-terminal binding protein [Caldilineaceae bacterium]MDE0336244.1 C-terminal binding protein [Caldilineaceae bacterium]
MSDWSHLEDFRVVRLNAVLSQMSQYERDRFREHHLHPFEVEANTPPTIIPRISDCDAIFVVSTALPEGVIESLSRCRVISRLGTGTDKIDVAAATRKGILVTNVPTFCVEEQADHTMALLLALHRKLPQMSAAMTSGAWNKARRQASTNQRLDGRVLGLVGFGNSARAVARRAQGFGIRVVATRRNMDAPKDAADELGVEMMGLEELLEQSDDVSLHLPLTDETYHLLDGAMLRKMKQGAYLINTSRGAIVDETALVDLLRAGTLAGAGIDTFEGIDVFVEEEGPSDHPLLSLDNVILSPHVGAISVQAMQDVTNGGIGNAAAVLSGYWPPAENLVNPEVVPRFPLAKREE